MPTSPDKMLYLVFCTGRDGEYTPEREVAEMDRPGTVLDIAQGQFDNVSRVLEFNPVEGICHDVTEDIARAVVSYWATEGEPLTDRQYEFVELHVSTQAANSFSRVA